jgi:hypothetical protein
MADYRSHEKLCDRFKAAMANADTWHSELKEAYRYTMPERYEMAAGNGAQNVPNYRTMYDSTGRTANEEFASFVTGAMYPSDQDWFRYVIPKRLPEDQRAQLAALADQYTVEIRSLIDQSNFYDAVLSANRDLGISNRFLRIEEDPDDATRIVVAGLLPTNFGVDEDRYGRVAGIFSKQRVKARELPYMYGGKAKWLDGNQRMATDSPGTDIELKEALCKHQGKWVHSVWDDDGEAAYEAEYETCPIIVTRMSKTIGQPWSVGPSLATLPDMRTANKVVELILKNAAIAATGIWLADDDGVLNPANIQLVPGSIIPKAVGSSGLTPLQSPGDFNVSELVLTDIRGRINMAHYVHRLPNEQMTAWEAQERVRENQRRLLGFSGQFRSEDVEPVLKRFADLGKRMGVVKDHPDLKLLELELLGPLAQARLEQQARRAMEAHQAIAGVFSGEAASVAFKYEIMIPSILNDLNVNPEFIATPDEIKETQQKVARKVAELSATPAGPIEPGAPPLPQASPAAAGMSRMAA